jgi:hypothetical protein
MTIEQSMQDNIKLEFSMEKNQHQKNILSFLRNNLQEITNKLNKTARFDLKSMQEDNITGEIHNLLDEKLRESIGYLIRFESRKGPDLLIFITPHQPFTAPLFFIEAKRLTSSTRKDYVKTGIGRFKEEKHAKNHNIAVMLGYVQENDFDHWFSKINGWIDDLIANNTITPKWLIHDKLKICTTSYPSEYESIHIRKNKEPIKLHHFWLDFSNN